MGQPRAYPSQIPSPLADSPLSSNGISGSLFSIETVTSSYVDTVVVLMNFSPAFCTFTSRNPPSCNKFQFVSTLFAPMVRTNGPCALFSLRFPPHAAQRSLWRITLIGPGFHC